MDERLAAEWPARRERLDGRSSSEGIDALFLPPSADLEYLTGVERDLPSFGEIIYAHNWVTGAFFVPGREPLFVLPRMFVAFHLGGNEPGELVVVNELDDGERAVPGRRRAAGRHRHDRRRHAHVGADDTRHPGRASRRAGRRRRLPRRGLAPCQVGRSSSS